MNSLNQLYIERLRTKLAEIEFKGAIVDFLGFVNSDDGFLRRITEDSPPATRFGIRSAQHIAVYGFPVLHANY